MTGDDRTEWRKTQGRKSAKHENHFEDANRNHHKKTSQQILPVLNLNRSSKWNHYRFEASRTRRNKIESFTFSDPFELPPKFTFRMSKSPSLRRIQGTFQLVFCMRTGTSCFQFLPLSNYGAFGLHWPPRCWFFVSFCLQQPTFGN